MNQYVNNLFNCDDDLGVKMFGASSWNRLKARAAASTDSMLEHPGAARLVKTDRRHDELFAKLFRPDVKAGSDLLGAGWCERCADTTLGDVFDSAKNFLSSNVGEGISSIGHGVANILSETPYVGKFVQGGRKVTNFAADVLNALGFGSGKNNVVQKAAIGGGTLLLIGAGLGVWYFGFHKKKKRGRR